jgi:hypothetical protein
MKGCVVRTRVPDTPTCEHSQTNMTTAAIASAAGCALTRTPSNRSEWVFSSSAAATKSARRTIELRTVPGKGIGGFATCPFAPGECIMVEKPLLAWNIRAGEPLTHDGLNACVDSLSDTDRTAFFGLCQNAEHDLPIDKMSDAERTQFFELCPEAARGEQYKYPYGIWLSNAFPTDSNFSTASRQGTSDVARSGAVFRYYCRLNHACAPNVHGAWNTILRCQTLYALRDIHEGEELTVSYLGSVDQERSQRQSALMDGFGFQCCCSKCELKGNTLRESDVRLQRCRQLTGLIADAVGAKGFQEQIAHMRRQHGSRPAALRNALKHARKRRLVEGLQLIEERLQILKEEHCSSLSWDTLWSAALHCSAMGETKEAIKWANKAAASACLALGKQSEEYLKYTNPSSLNGLNMM